MTRASVCRLVPAVMVGVLAAAIPAGAQTNEEIFEQFQWNFATPGARANAMGQAFIGVADDASATITNPAGLVNLARRQVYVEFKSDNYQVDRLAAANAFTTRDTRTFGQRQGSVPFIDIAVPISSRLAVAFTRHEFLNAQESFNLEARPVPGVDFTLFPVDATSEFLGVAYAGSVAFAPMTKLKLGATIAFNQFEARTRSTRFDFLRPTIVVNESSIDDSSTSTSFTFGALFTPSDRVSVGAVYAKGPDFTVSEDFRLNPRFVLGQNSPTLNSFPGFPKTVSIHVPDRIGVGVALRPQARLLIAADVQLVQYSSLVDDFTLILSFDDPNLARGFSIEDRTELHFGAEWMLMSGSMPVFVRGGVYTNPHHGIRFSPASTDASLNAAYSALFNLTDPETQVAGTVGAGVTLGRALQLDAAFVQGGDFVLSAAFRF